MELERKLNRACLEYRKAGLAFIRKIELPMRIVKGGVLRFNSTVDYEGVVKGGKYYAMEAKETESMTSFPLSQIKQHQLEYLKGVDAMGGIAYFIIWFKKKDEKAFLVPAKFIANRWDGMIRSVKYEDFDQEWLVNIETFLEKMHFAP